VTISQFEQQFGKDPMGKHLCREARRLVRGGEDEHKATSKVVADRLQRVQSSLSDLESDRSEEAD
jgi:hypothetical protein